MAAVRHDLFDTVHTLFLGDDELGGVGVCGVYHYVLVRRGVEMVRFVRVNIGVEHFTSMD